MDITPSAFTHQIDVARAQRSAVVVIGVLAVVCLVDWLARTRRINPFHPIARFLRETVDPLIAPLMGAPDRARWVGCRARPRGGRSRRLFVLA